MRIDLHTHSNASDGTDTPAGVIAAAAAAGLDVVALTDHDTTAGWAEATAALRPGLTLVPGAELSTISVDPATGAHVSVHLLAYLFDPDAPAVLAEQERLLAERRGRLRTMAERMGADGLPIDADDIFARVPENVPIGRPHLAQALVRAGLVDSVGAAFDSYLANGGPYYLPRADTPIEAAIDMVAAAGGVTVMAHPFARSRGDVVTAEVIAELARRGLAGLEVDHPDHDPATRAELAALAADLDLLRTGSSDYHGDNKTIAIGQETTAAEQYEAIVARGHGARIRVGA